MKLLGRVRGGVNLRNHKVILFGYKRKSQKGRLSPIRRDLNFAFEGF